MHFVPMKAEHALRLVDLESIHAGFDLTPELAVDLEEIGGTAGLIGDRVVGVAGILPRWPGVGMAWAWLGRGWRAEARAITDHIRATLDASELHRIEAAVRVDYARGHSWMRLLGFQMEVPCARKWGPDGADYSLYSRTRDG